MIANFGVSICLSRKLFDEKESIIHLHLNKTCVRKHDIKHRDACLLVSYLLELECENREEV